VLKSKQVITNLAGLTFFAISGTAFANTIVFSDSTFTPANYSTAFKYLQDPVNDSATYVQCTSCGNPGQALALTINEPNGGGTFNSTEVLIGILNTTFTYNPSTQGAITSISASVDKDFTVAFGNNSTLGFGNTFRPLIMQDGNYYVAAISGPVLNAPGTTGYNTLSNGSLLAANFLQVNPVTGVIGTANPNFAGDPMTFGIAQLLAASAISGTTATIDYDNLNITLTTAPEPSSFWTLLAGVMTLSAAARLRGRLAR
jgi:hypothetical protein